MLVEEACAHRKGWTRVTYRCIEAAEEQNALLTSRSGRELIRKETVSALGLARTSRASM